MSDKTWKDGLRDGRSGRDSNPPPKPIFQPTQPDRDDYRDGYAKGEKDANK
jgi:hypothetical protein